MLRLRKIHGINRKSSLIPCINCKEKVSKDELDKEGICDFCFVAPPIYKINPSKLSVLVDGKQIKQADKICEEKLGLWPGTLRLYVSNYMKELIYIKFIHRQREDEEILVNLKDKSSTNSKIILAGNTYELENMSFKGSIVLTTIKPTDLKIFLVGT